MVVSSHFVWKGAIKGIAPKIYSNCIAWKDVRNSARTPFYSTIFQSRVNKVLTLTITVFLL